MVNKSISGVDLFLLRDVINKGKGIVEGKERKE